jgi:hypothetical protein
MSTGTQTQTAWAPWIRDLAETLEKCLAEVKHQDLKFQQPEPLTWGSLLHAMIHWKNRWVATPTLPLSGGMLGSLYRPARPPTHRPTIAPPNRKARLLLTSLPGHHTPAHQSTTSLPAHQSSRPLPSSLLGCCPQNSETTAHMLVLPAKRGPHHHQTSPENLCKR